MLVLSCLGGVQVGTGLAAATTQPARSAAGVRSLPPDEAQEKALLQAAGGEGFHTHRTAHFAIAYNTSRALVESLSARLEQTYDSVSRFCERSGFPARDLDRRLEVVFFNTQDDYARYARPFRFNSRGTYGFYYERTNRSAFFNVHNDRELRQLDESIRSARENADQLEETVKSIRGSAAFVDVVYADGRRARLSRAQAKDEIEETRRKIVSLDRQQRAYCDRINRTVIQHEVAHHVLYNTGLHARFAANPKWLVEGLACMFESPPSANGSGLSAVNQSRLKDFREAIAGDSEAKVLNSGLYERAVDEGRMTSLADLIQHNELFESRGEEGATHYAAAWALVHYLHRTQNKALPAYLREIAARKPGTVPKPDEELALFEKHFGPVDDAFAARFSNFIFSLPYRPE